MQYFLTFFDVQRLLTESQKEGLAKDFIGLNLSKYVEEAVSPLFKITKFL